MKKTILSIALTLAFALGIQAQEKNVNVAESNIHWLGKKVTGQHEGNISLSSGTLIMKEGELTGGQFIVNMNSMTCTDMEGEYADKLIGHLKSDDFFGTATHPEASLVFTSVKAKGNGMYTITGDFTIKNITHSASFDLTLSEGSASAKVVIDRSKYDIRYGSNSFFDNLGDKAIYNDFELDVTLKM